MPQENKILKLEPEEEDYISEEYCAHNLDEFATLSDDDVAIMASDGNAAAIWRRGGGGQPEVDPASESTIHRNAPLFALSRPIRYASSQMCVPSNPGGPCSASC